MTDEKKPPDYPPLTADEIVEALAENPRPIFGKVGTAGGVHISDGPFQVYEPGDRKSIFQVADIHEDGSLEMGPITDA